MNVEDVKKLFEKSIKISKFSVGQDTGAFLVRFKDNSTSVVVKAGVDLNILNKIINLLKNNGILFPSII